jgi:hypothetical protein
MSHLPGYDVGGGTRFKILFENGAIPYLKVEFIDGPSKGRVGWLSRGSFDDPRTRFP